MSQRVKIRRTSLTEAVLNQYGFSFDDWFVILHELQYHFTVQRLHELNSEPTVTRLCFEKDLLIFEDDIKNIPKDVDVQKLMPKMEETTELSTKTNLIYCKDQPIVNLKEVEIIEVDEYNLEFHFYHGHYVWNFETPEQAQKAYENILKMYCTEIKI